MVHVGAWMALHVVQANTINTQPQLNLPTESMLSYVGEEGDLAPTLPSVLTLSLAASFEYQSWKKLRVRDRGQLYRPFSENGDFLENLGYITLLKMFTAVSELTTFSKSSGADYDFNAVLWGPTSFLFLLFGPFELKKLLLRFLYLHYLLFPLWESAVPLRNSNASHFAQQSRSSSGAGTERRLTTLSRGNSLRGTVGRARERLQQLGEKVTRSRTTRSRRNSNPELRNSKGKF